MARFKGCIWKFIVARVIYGNSFIVFFFFTRGYNLAKLTIFPRDTVQVSRSYIVRSRNLVGDKGASTSNATSNHRWPMIFTRLARKFPIVWAGVFRISMAG